MPPPPAPPPPAPRTPAPRPDAPRPDGPRTEGSGPGHASAGDPAIETRGLTKAYRGGRLAVDGLDQALYALVFGSAAWARFAGRDITA
ncbi:hypothetical protein GCM10012285_54440 [Streptomyces kronopolitis]|uniref:Uncharacterized protein n=1 Tax=Streptomyces kronopolitis TaxID=1612435 RepID=A0ABQ2JX65_9ACTN|nr:hypothetical protein [Streptomyces kronopolitis]GGN58245.1 hypothetical protein GCM10012285_54440 [Streptomyces kronopolitis]